MAAEPTPQANGARPNIVYFLVDDLGYADVGFIGSKDVRTPNMAIRMGDWKLVLKSDTTLLAGDLGAAKVELYNLADDIGESKDLAASRPEKVEEMRARLEALLKDAVPPGLKDATPTVRARKAGGQKKGTKKR